MTVAEDVITTEEVVADLVEEEAILEVQLQEEKGILLHDVKVQVAVVLEATETQRHAKVVLAEEVTLEVQLQEEKVVLPADLQEPKDLQKERQDVLKVSEILQDQEDLEKTNIYLLIFL